MKYKLTKKKGHRTLYLLNLKREDDVWFLTDKKDSYKTGKRKGSYPIICANCFKNPKKDIAVSKLHTERIIEKLGRAVKLLICKHECWKP